MFFGRPESVRESFQRLYPIRLDTMHARPITQDDELLLYVETRRLVKILLGDCGVSIERASAVQIRPEREGTAMATSNRVGAARSAHIIPRFGTHSRHAS